MRLKGQVALVTGGGTGIGQGISTAFAREGASVAVNYQKSKEKAEGTVRRIRESGGQAMALQADVRREADCKRLVDEVVREWGRLDVLVNNAGWTTPVAHGDLEALTDEIWRKVLDTNVMGAWYCIKHAAPVMRGQGRGVIINITSVAAFSGKGSSMAYAASKAALGSMTRSLARALGPAIRVNSLAPGLVETEFVGWPLQRVRGRAPRGRHAGPADARGLRRGGAVPRGRGARHDGDDDLRGRRHHPAPAPRALALVPHGPTRPRADRREDARPGPR